MSENILTEPFIRCSSPESDGFELFFIKKLRDEKKFENSEQLKVQILSDIDKARNLFNEIYKNN